MQGRLTFQQAAHALAVEHQQQLLASQAASQAASHMQLPAAVEVPATAQHSTAPRQSVLQEQATAATKEKLQEKDGAPTQQAGATGFKRHTIRLQAEADSMRTQLQAVQHGLQHRAAQVSDLTSQLQQARSVQQSPDQHTSALEKENSCLRAEISKLQAMLAREQAQHAVTAEREQQVTAALLTEQQRHSTTQAALTASQQKVLQESEAAGILRSHVADSEDAIAEQQDDITCLQEKLDAASMEMQQQQDAAAQQQADAIGFRWQVTRLQAEVHSLQAQQQKSAAWVGQLRSQLQQAASAKQQADERAAQAHSQHSAAASELAVLQEKLGSSQLTATVLAEQLEYFEETLTSLRSSSGNTICELKQQLYMVQQQQCCAGTAAPAGPAGRMGSCDGSSGIAQAVCGAGALAHSRDWGSGLSEEALADKDSSGGVSNARIIKGLGGSGSCGVVCSTKVSVCKVLVRACSDDGSDADVDVFFDVVDADGCACMQ